MPPFTLLDEDRAHTVAAQVHGARVRVSPEAVHQALGWELKPEGLCREAVCIPVRDRDALVADGALDLEALADALGRPLALDTDAGAAALGTAPADRAASLASGEAPEFSLPDLDGRLHSLSEHRGKKVLLIAYASW